MNFSNMTYEHIRVSPFELDSIKELKIVQKFNDHARLTFTGVIKEDKKDYYAESADMQSSVKVIYISDKVLEGVVKDEKNPNNIILFQGIITHIEVKVVQGIYYLYVEAVSHTYELDILQSSCSFQDVEMTFAELVNQVIAPYSGAEAIYSAGANILTGEFILRYGETEWEFIKRMASKFNTGLAAAMNFSVPKFYFGIPQGMPEETLLNPQYTVEKKMGKWIKSLVNRIPGWVEEYSLASYRVQSEKMLGIGQKVLFNGKILFVASIVSSIQNGILLHDYILTTEWGLKQDTFYNTKLIGASIPGVVLDVYRERIKVHLAVNETQDKEKAYWFEYASMYSGGNYTGFYCMPEIGEWVRIYFPSQKEREGVAVNAVQQPMPWLNDWKMPWKDETKPKYDLERDRWVDPAIKSFKVKDKEIIFAPDRIIIHIEGTSITLHDEAGIDIISETNINIKAQEKISVTAAEVEITGEEKITLNCEGNAIRMSKLGVKIN